MTKVKTTWLGRGLITAVCLVALLAWFGVQAGHAQDHSKVMQDSGFKQWKMDTPKEKTYFKKVPPDQIVTYKRKNQTIHVYSEPKSGNIYFGDDAAYQQYLQKVKAQNITPKSQGPFSNPNDPEFWDMYMDSQGGG